MQFEEQALEYQQELLNYKRDTEAKILLLQSKYNEELAVMNQEKHYAIEQLTKKIQAAQEKRLIGTDDNNKFKLGVSTPQELSRSFTILRQDTGSTGSKVISHSRQHSDSHVRNQSMHNLKKLLSNTLQINKKTQKMISKSINRKSHRKSAQSLNFSKVTERHNSKSKVLSTHSHKSTYARILIVFIEKYQNYVLYRPHMTEENIQGELGNT